MKARLQALLAVVVAELKDIWNRGKMVLLALLALIGIVEFEKLKELLLVYLANKQIKSNNKIDQGLAAKQDSANSQADALVQQAQQLGSNQPTVQPDWYKKK